MRFSSHLLLFLPLLFTHCGLFKSNTPEPSVAEADSIQEAQTTPAPEPEKPVSAKVEPNIKRKILVLPFANRTSYGGTELGEHAAAVLNDRIEKFNGFVPATDTTLEPVEEITRAVASFNYGNIFDKARAKGVSGVIVGSIDSVQMGERGSDVGLFQTRYYTVQANVRYSFYDTSNEKLIYSHQTTAEVTEEHTEFTGNRQTQNYDASKSKGAVSKAIEKSFPQLTYYSKQLAWVGRIAKIDMNRFYINAGESSGLLRGHLLKVTGEGFNVTDSATGTDLGIAPGIFKGVLRIVDYFGNDGSIAVIHSGAGFKENDRVELYSSPQR